MTTSSAESIEALMQAVAILARQLGALEAKVATLDAVVQIRMLGELYGEGSPKPKKRATKRVKRRKP